MMKALRTQGLFAWTGGMGPTRTGATGVASFTLPAQGVLPDFTDQRDG